MSFNCETQTASSQQIKGDTTKQANIGTPEDLLTRILANRRGSIADRGRYKEPVPPDHASVPDVAAGWTVASIDQIAVETLIGLDRGRAQQSADPSSGAPYVKMNNVTMDGEVRCEELVYVPVSQDEANRYSIRDGDILFNTRNSKELVGKVGLVRNPPPGSIFNNNLMRIRVAEEVSPAFVALQMCSHDFRQRMELVKKATTNVAAVYAKDLLPLAVVLPSFPEQQRIVAEIEKQFTRLDAGVAALNRVQANLKRYRAAVLKAACEGRLVPTEAELAKQNKTTFETGEALLARILAERRENWNGRGKYKEPSTPTTKSQPLLPEGWTVASLEQLTSASRPICYGILMPKENVAEGVLFVKVKDMKGDKIDLDGLHRTTPDIAAKYARASLRAGDILLSIRGTYGRIAEVPQELDGGNITQDTARLDVTCLLNHRYVATCLRNPECQNYFKNVARGVAVKGVNIGDVRPTPIPLPPAMEQDRIVAEVERRLSVIEELEMTVSLNLQRAARLRQSILQKAFTGGL